MKKALRTVGAGSILLFVAFVLVVGAVAEGQTAGGLDTALLRAAATGDAAAVQQLLKNGANANTTESHNGTALYMASYGGYADVVKLLLAASANVDIADYEGFTPLMIASQQGHADVVKLLLATSANVNAANNRDATALFLASQGGQADIVKLLLASRANVNAATKGGPTPLHVAAQHDHADVVKLLLAAGANVNAATDSGVTPLMVASHFGHADVVQLLKAADASPMGHGQGTGNAPSNEIHWGMSHETFVDGTAVSRDPLSASFGANCKLVDSGMSFTTDRHGFALNDATMFSKFSGTCEVRSGTGALRVTEGMSSSELEKAAAGAGLRVTKGSYLPRGESLRKEITGAYGVDGISSLEGFYFENDRLLAFIGFVGM